MRVRVRTASDASPHGALFLPRGGRRRAARPGRGDAAPHLQRSFPGARTIACYSGRLPDDLHPVSDGKLSQTFGTPSEWIPTCVDPGRGRSPAGVAPELAWRSSCASARVRSSRSYGIALAMYWGRSGSRDTPIVFFGSPVVGRDLMIVYSIVVRAPAALLALLARFGPAVISGSRSSARLLTSFTRRRSSSPTCRNLMVRLAYATLDHGQRWLGRVWCARASGLR